MVKVPHEEDTRESSLHEDGCSEQEWRDDGSSVATGYSFALR
jgi:hypothetical protein